ncbi:MAG: hypothetical protein ABGX28_01395 [Methylococcales bacterium]
MLKDQETIRVDTNASADIKRLISQALVQKTKAKEFYVAPVIIKSKPVGLFYTDRSTSRRNMEDASYDSFLLFSQQVGMLLDRLIANNCSLRSPQLL